jgi:hypothetical protein
MLEDAERHGQDALATFSACGARFEVGRTHLARVGEAREDLPRARDHG